MTDTVISEEQFSAFVRRHRGDYVGEAAAFVAAFVGQVGGDRSVLQRLLSWQVPAYELVSAYAVATPDGEQELPDVNRVTQVVPADGSCRIGHVVPDGPSWLAYHYAAPTQQIGVAGPQINAVIRVFVEHYITLRRLYGE